MMRRVRPSWPQRRPDGQSSDRFPDLGDRVFAAFCNGIGRAWFRDMAFAEAEATTRRISYVRIRPRIMLIRVEREAAQASNWGLEELDAEVLYVKHPLPACERMRVTRPAIVIVGEEVRPVDVAYIKREARELGARVVQIGPLLVRDSLRKWLRTALSEALDAASEPEAAAE
jgi:hypothetical protein